MKRLLITAGPTVEPLDPVRFLSNQSTGEMGYAIARQAKKKGWCVTLISGPVPIDPPKGVRLLQINTAAELRQACVREFPQHDRLIMAAAVCDFTPSKRSQHKIQRRGTLRMTLKKTPDILAELTERKGRRQVIGFCLESRKWIENAILKCRRKKLDGIVAHKIGPGHIPFGACKVQAALIDRAGKVHRLRKLDKAVLAVRILRWADSLAICR
ncbi:MAG: phosphopantothenoylcysteine decarboxylase [Candidatus Omnitrophota bacterium]